MQNNLDNHRLAAYLRDSGGGEQDLSLPQQEIEVRKWCRDNHFTLTKIFRDEARPGSSTIGREGFNTMISYFRSQECGESGIVLWKYSRFARDIDDAQFYRSDLRRRGFQIYSIKDTIPDGLNGRFFEAAIDWMNARFLEDLSTDVKRGLHHLVKNYGAMPGTPACGFKREKVNLGKRRDGTAHIVSKWVPDPEIWDRCKKAWQMRASGESYRRIHEVTRIYSSKNSYSGFFRNRIYLGELQYGDVVINVEPMVDQQTWDAVQALNKINAGNNTINRKDGSAIHPRRANSNFILSGKVFCAKCSAIMNGEVVHFKAKRAYEYYVCSSAQRRMDCTARGIPRHTLEDAVIQAFRDYLLDPKLLNALQQEILHDQNINDQAVNVQIIEFKSQLSIIRRQITNLTDLLASQAPDDQSRSLLSKLGDLEAQETITLYRLAELEKSLDKKLPALSFEDLKLLVRKIEEMLEKENNATKKKILQGFIEKITVERERKTIRGVVQFRYPPKDIFMPTVTDSVGAPHCRHKSYAVTINFPIKRHP